jgi:hypothetical protein
MNSDEKAQNEYCVIAENLRHYENLLFANLAAFLTVNGGLVGLVYASRSPLPHCILVRVELLGMFVALAFGVHCQLYLWRVYKLVTRAIALENDELKYKLYQLTSPPKFPKLGRLWWGSLFVVVFIFWLIMRCTTAMQSQEKPNACSSSSRGMTSTTAP